MHPRYKHWHLIDYVITRIKDAKDIIVTKAMWRADLYRPQADSVKSQPEGSS